MAEYNKHKNDKGYVNEAISKDLVFDSSIVTKDTKIDKITGGKFIKASDFNKVNQGQSKDIFTKLSKDMNGKQQATSKAQKWLLLNLALKEDTRFF